MIGCGLAVAIKSNINQFQMIANPGKSSMFLVTVLLLVAVVSAQTAPASCASCAYPACPVSTDTTNFETNVRALYGCLCAEPVLQEYESCRQCGPGLASLDLGARDQADAYCRYFQQDVFNGTYEYNEFRTLILSKPNYIDMRPVIEIYPDVRDKLGSYVVEYVDTVGLDAFNANYSSIFIWIDVGGPASYSSTAVASSSAPTLGSGSFASTSTSTGTSSVLSIPSGSSSSLLQTGTTPSTAPLSEHSGNTQLLKLHRFLVLVAIISTAILFF